MDKETIMALVRRVGEGDEQAKAALESEGILTVSVIEGAGSFPSYKLPGTDLVGADFSGLHAVLSDFSGSDLSGADFSGAVLVGSSFVGADLSGASFRGAIAVDADFRDTEAYYARLEGRIPPRDWPS